MGAFLSYQTMTPPSTDELAWTNTMLLKHPLLWVFVFLWQKQKGGTCLTCVKKLSVQESTSHLPPPSLLLFTSLQIDNKGWNGQKASFTEATSNCEYQHVSLCFFSISISFASPPPHHSLHPTGGFSRREGPPFNLCDWSMGFWLSA